MKLSEFLSIVTIISAILMSIAILLQARGASLGAGAGASGELFTTRRGFEKNLYDTTAILAVIFILSLLANLVIA